MDNLNENSNADQPKQLWCIDMDWYSQNHRSFLLLARGCLCQKCQKKQKTGKGKGDISGEKLLATIKDCCSESRDFITQKLPILESVFRIFLANANQPLDIEELVKQLSERRGNTYCISAESLSNLLASDEYYGLNPVEN